MTAAAQMPPDADPDQVTEVDSATVLTWLEAGEIILVDVRETVEYEADHIPGALLCPLSTFEPELFPKFPGKRVVIHCAVGKRSAAACKQLQKFGYPNEVSNLEGGIGAWKAAGCPTEVQPEDRADIPFVEGAEPLNELPIEAGAHPGLILHSEFMAPFGLTSEALADAVGVPPDHVSAIVRGERSISPEIALRLARHLCTTEEFWLRLQTAHDLTKAKQAFGDKINLEVKPRRTGKIVRASA